MYPSVRGARIPQVDQTVPQTYIQEHFVDRYKEVPVTQVQETERVEHVPVMVPNDWRPPNMQALGIQNAAPAIVTT